MDQMPSKSIDQPKESARIDQNNNNINNKESYNKIKKVNACSCTNISIMQLFHEMKQEFPKVPDNIVQQLVADNCHNRRACFEELQKAIVSTLATPTMYPSKSIFDNQQTPRSPLNGVKWSNNKRMRELSEKFESTSINSSSSSSTSTSEMTSPTSSIATGMSLNDMRIKRPTTLPLRRAPDPPMRPSNLQSSPSQTAAATSSSTSVSSISSLSHAQHHNVTLDSTASKINDSLNVQLNVTVSPISAKSPIIAKRPAPPPPPLKPNRFTSQLSMQPEPPFTSMLDQAKNTNSSGATASTGVTASGKKSYTKVNFTLRQPTSIIPSPQAPIEIQAGPQSLTYSSTSFNAKQGYESHLTITVAGNGESCIQAVRTLPPNSSSQIAGELNQIDTTISIEGSSNCNTNDGDDDPPLRIVSSPYSQFALPHNLSNDYRLVDDTELRLRIQRQIKQKQSLECELEKEREKLEMIRLDIITLTSPCMTYTDMKELCDEITRLRSICERLTDEIDVMSETPVRSPHSINSHGPPPIPRELRSRRGYSPNPQHLPSQLDTSGIRYPSSQPPSYHEVMSESSPSSNRSMSSHYQQPADDGKWTCSLCTFTNHCLLQICEACELPRNTRGQGNTGITLTSSSYQPLLQNNQLQRSNTNDNFATAL